jgi:hypothetical protein
MSMVTQEYNERRPVGSEVVNDQDGGQTRPAWVDGPVEYPTADGNEVFTETQSNEWTNRIILRAGSELICVPRSPHSGDHLTPLAEFSQYAGANPIGRIFE